MTSPYLTVYLFVCLFCLLLENLPAAAGGTPVGPGAVAVLQNARGETPWLSVIFRTTTNLSVQSDVSDIIIIIIIIVRSSHAR